MKGLMAKILIGALMVFPLVAVEDSKAQEVINFPQETLTYVVKKLGITAGEATLQYVGLTDLEGRQVIKIVFTVEGFNFYDKENIFADPVTLLPLRVERDLNIFGNKEQIVEYYDRERHLVRVVKYDNDEVIEETVFQKEEPIDNLYCFLYRYRARGVFEQGRQLKMNLPTKMVVFEIESQQSINAAGERRQAWLMESEPKEYRVWFGVESDKFPLRIDGSAGFAKTVMILREINTDKID